MIATDVKWVEDEGYYGFRPGMAVEFKVDGKWHRYGVRYAAHKKEEARNAVIAWAAERGVDLSKTKQ